MVQWLRWAGVLPAAVLVGAVIAWVPELVFVLMAPLLQDPAVRGQAARTLGLPFYAAKTAGFVFAGARVAPRGGVATAIALAVLQGSLSLATHVLLQNHRGFTNYLHLSLETTGVILGVAAVVLSERARRARLTPGSA